jgi:hypothetical protein
VKSVSTLWAVADPAVAAVIEWAHQAAVKDALAFIEEHALFTRTGPQGIRQVNVRGLVAAAFTHRDSRAGDPDLWLNSDVTAGTFREPLRLTDRRARAADRQENRPTFTGWSGYPTHVVVCDRDGMTVRAADHRDNTSVRMMSRLSSVVKRPHRCACLGAAVAVPGRHTETYRGRSR